MIPSLKSRADYETLLPVYVKHLIPTSQIDIIYDQLKREYEISLLDVILSGMDFEDPNYKSIEEMKDNISLSLQIDTRVLQNVVEKINSLTQLQVYKFTVRVVNLDKISKGKILAYVQNGSSW